jgi:NADPH-dependent glutamate synthase beta subunit-like oxidoreductase/Pyruvate/2-oxoacid:ferredoxin oxidoreductase delta subunit
MGLFKEVKKPVIRSAAASGADVSPRRPGYVAKTAPCIHSCPSRTDVRGWLIPVAQHEAYGRTLAQAFEQAWGTILEHNPFPAICGRVCQHPCELNCNRKDKEGPVAVNRLEQFIGDFAIAQGLRAGPVATRKADAARIAVVGAGPAGLSAAYHMARKGYGVTVIDAAPHPGGLMRYRIPRSVIPEEVLDAEIGNILGLGIELRTGCVVGRDVSLEELQLEFHAVFFAIGLQKAAQLELRVGSEGKAAMVGELPVELPEILQEEAAETVPRVLNTVSVAIGQGRAVADAIADHLEGGAAAQTASPTVIRSDRLKLEWYPAAQRVESKAPLSEAEVLFEAARCMSCGMCMDCETCWMYCSKNCFVKLPKGEHYKIKIDLCNGCGKCVESCPCGYIEMN